MRLARSTALRCAAVLAAAVPLAGVDAAPASGPRVHVVVIDKMKFGAVPAGLRVGDTVRWVNRDMFRHTATARDGSFNIDLMPGKSADVVLRRSGTLAFYCIFHPGMRGQLAVAR